jgi:MFS family permease
MEKPLHETTLWQDLRSLSSEYWILFWGTLISRFGYFVMPFMTFYLRHEDEIGRGDYPEWKIGLVLSAYGAGSLVAGLLGGYLSDRFGRKPTMLFSCFGGAALLLVLSQAQGLLQLIPCIFTMALITSLYSPAAGALIADLVPPHLRARAYACQRLAINVGFGAGMACAGFMAKHSFGLLFIIDACCTCILGFVVLWGLKPRTIPATLNNSWAHALKHMRGNKPFMLAAASVFCIAIVFNQVGGSYSLQATERAQLPASFYGYMLALNGILIGLFELPLTNVTRRYHPTYVMAVGYAIAGIGLGLNAIDATVTILLISMLVFTFGEMLALPIGNSYLAALAPDDMRGRYQGLIATTWSLAGMLGPSIGLAIYQFSHLLLWGLVLLLGCLAAVFMLLTDRH